MHASCDFDQSRVHVCYAPDILGLVQHNIAFSYVKVSFEMWVFGTDIEACPHPSCVKQPLFIGKVTADHVSFDALFYQLVLTYLSVLFCSEIVSWMGTPSRRITLYLKAGIIFCSPRNLHKAGYLSFPALIIQPSFIKMTILFGIQIQASLMGIFRLCKLLQTCARHLAMLREWETSGLILIEL